MTDKLSSLKYPAFASPDFKNWFIRGVTTNQDSLVWAEIGLKMLTPNGISALARISYKQSRDALFWLEKTGIELPELARYLNNPQYILWTQKSLSALKDMTKNFNAKPEFKDHLYRGISQQQDPNAWADAALNMITSKGMSALESIQLNSEIFVWLEDAGIDTLDFYKTISDPTCRSWAEKAFVLMKEKILEKKKQPALPKIFKKEIYTKLGFKEHLLHGVIYHKDPEAWSEKAVLLLTEAGISAVMKDSHLIMILEGAGINYQLGSEFMRDSLKAGWLNKALKSLRKKIKEWEER